MTLDEFFAKVEEYEKSTKCAGWRVGQILFNALSELNPAVAAMLQATTSDPFHAIHKEDGRYLRAVAFIKANWHLKDGPDAKKEDVKKEKAAPLNFDGMTADAVFTSPMAVDFRESVILILSKIPIVLSAVGCSHILKRHAAKEQNLFLNSLMSTYGADVMTDFIQDVLMDTGRYLRDNNWGLRLNPEWKFTKGT